MTFKAPLYGEANRAVGVIGVCRDVTDLRQAEMALRGSEELFRLIIENSRDIAYSIDLKTGTLNYVSPAIFPATGYTPRETATSGIGGWLLRIHPEDRPRLLIRARERAKRPLPAQRHERIEYRIRHRDGHYLWMSQSTTTLTDAEGRPETEIGTVRDITERKRIDDARASGQPPRGHGHAGRRHRARVQQLDGGRARQRGIAANAAFRQSGCGPAPDGRSPSRPSRRANWHIRCWPTPTAASTTCRCST